MSCDKNDPNKDKLFVKGEDKMMAALPYFHIFGMTVSMVGSMRMGAELLILPNPRDVKQVLQTIHDKKPDVFPVVPRLLRAMLDSPDLHKYDISSLKVVMSGGAALPPDLKKEFETVTGIPVIQGYGLTETSPVACVHHPLAADNDSNSVGYVVPKTEVMIADVNSQGQLKALPSGQTGEICIKGPQVMKGYWQKPEENKKVLSGAWFKTGDVGRIGENGQIYITDRIKDMGLINGKNVYAVPIEKEIQQHSDVLECNVVFVKDKSAGEAAMAFMRIKEGSKLNETEIRSFFDDMGMSKYHKPKHLVFWSQGMSKYHKPKHLVFWSHDKELPKTNVGKPDKKELRVIAQNILNEKSKQSTPKPPTME
jgi:long-chain acyl-CoA synthetase